ncbi:MAG: signal peptidase II [Rubripirellula sp.]
MNRSVTSTSATQRTAASDASENLGEPNGESDNKISPVSNPVRRMAIFTALLIIGLIADLASKQIAFDRMGLPGQSDPAWVIDGIFGVQTAVNPGAVFGLGAGKGLVFAAFSIFAIIGIILWMLRFEGYQSLWLTVTLGLISGGILGNLYDRLGFWWAEHLPLEWKSGVRDWILFRLEGVPFFDPWPNFNIADALLVLGAGMLFYQSLVLDPRNEQKVD